MPLTIDLSYDSIPIDSGTGTSADDEPISEQTASLAAGQSPSPNDDNTTSCGYDTYHFPGTSTDMSMLELTASLAVESPPSPNDENCTPCENMHH